MKKISPATQKSALRKARKELREQMFQMFESGITAEQMEQLLINFLGEDFKKFLEKDRQYQAFKANRAKWE